MELTFKLWRLQLHHLWMESMEPEHMWRAYVFKLHWEEGGPERFEALGETPLIAAMRAYVASKFGEEVEL